MKKSNVVLGALLSVSALFLGGCNTTDEKVEQRTAKETPTRDMGELTTRGFETWAGSANIDIDQKSKLWTIHSATARDAFRIRGEISKAKTALFKELADGGRDMKMIDGLKKKIVKLDQERLDLMFKSLDSVEKVLGTSDQGRDYYRYLDELESRGFDGR